MGSEGEGAKFTPPLREMQPGHNWPLPVLLATSVMPRLEIFNGENLNVCFILGSQVYKDKFRSCSAYSL